ncbi:ATP-binding protein [Streptomyces sp. DT2A-34]|uniref:AAA family ATPase n=1 Tax=Streptomyces sp. DT2A-34 TaxID=3051182 RepID=UPI0034639267
MPALHRFTEAIAAHAGVRPGAMRLDDWRDVLTAALEVVNRASGAPLIVIDELPYLMQHSPEIPGFLQLLYDQSQSGKAPGGRIVLCGSAMSVMSELLSGTKPLRGRAVLDLRLPAFDYRTARTHWGIEDPAVALQVDAVLGGAPGYRPLAAGPAPQSETELGPWVERTLLDPGRAPYSRVEAESCCARTLGSPTARCTTTSCPPSPGAPRPQRRSAPCWSAPAPPWSPRWRCSNPPATSARNRTCSRPGTRSSASRTR